MRGVSAEVAQARGVLALLEAALQKYHKRLIDAAAVNRTIMKIHAEMRTDDQRVRELGQEEGELALCDAITVNCG